MMRRVRGVIARATSSGSSAKTVFEPPLEVDDVGAEQTRGAGQRVVARTLHQHVVARLEDGGEGLEVGARGAVCRRDLLGARRRNARRWRRRAARSRCRCCPVSASASRAPARSSIVQLETLLPARSNRADWPLLRPLHVGRVKSHRLSRVGFRRALGPFDATMVVIGGIIGSGIFINPYIVAQRLDTSAPRARRVGGRRLDRAGRRVRLRRARSHLSEGRRPVRLPARRLASARRLHVRLGAAAADRERRDRRRRDHVRHLRAAARRAGPMRRQCRWPSRPSPPCRW